MTTREVPEVVVPLRARETIRSKSVRYLIEGRLTVIRVAGDLVEADCAGSGATYQLGHESGVGWWCSCPSKRNCSHLAALRMVVRPS